MSENTANAIRTLTHSVKTEAIVPGLANPQRQFTFIRKTRAIISKEFLPLIALTAIGTNRKNVDH